MEHHNVQSTVANLADGDAAVRFLHAQEEIRRTRSRRRWIAAGIVLASLFLLMVGCSALVVGAASSATAPAPSVPVSAPAASDPVGAPRDTATAPAATVAPEAPETAPVGPYPPAAAFSEGMWTVGPDAEIAPGTYRSPGPTATGIVKLCYVDAKIDDHYAAQEVSDGGPVRITVTQGQTVSTNGCQRFVKVG